MPVIEGSVERITFYNEENSFTVAKFQQEPDGTLTTIVGNLPGISVGETLRLTGEWINHPEYGRQFQVEAVERVAPATLVGMERYLGSGLIKGIGPVTAKKIVRAFGLAALDIIRARPERLTQIEGIGPKKAERIAQAVQAQKEISEIMVFLQGCGITPVMATKIYRAYGRHAIAMIRENPYRLADEVYGIGFKTADAIAAKLGVVATSPHRIKAGVVFLLNEFCREGGHVYAPEEEFSATAASELGVPENLVHQAISTLLEERELFVERDREGRNFLYPAPFYHAERGVAARLIELLRQPLPLRPGDPEALLDRLTAADGIRLTAAQRRAILMALQHGVTIITGGPGTGKTTTVRSLLRLYAAFGLRFLLAAPTGRAAKRLAETTGHEAKTIHRLLEFGYNDGARGFLRNEERPLETDALILDEVSMIDLPLFYQLLKAVAPGTRLVLVGDADQLPSVGPGNVLRDLIAAQTIPTVRLDTIFRQAEASLIVLNAHRINQGAMPVFPSRGEEGDFYFLPCEDPEKIVEEVLELVAKRLPEYLKCDPIEDIQVLAPMRRTVTGVDNLNRLLQERLNPPRAGRPELQYGNTVLRERDKVMQIRNNYQKMVFNGDMGRIRLIDREEGQVHVAFPDVGGERLVVYEREELDELAVSYAISVHKSQGSEYPVVVLPITTQHYMMLQRNLLYTAVTRAKRMVVLVGTKKALAIAVHNNKTETRNSLLAERLRRGVE
ncbi:MAG: SF1B family DNA helicase RecD2 [Bacillota bacterium]